MGRLLLPQQPPHLGLFFDRINTTLILFKHMTSCENHTQNIALLYSCMSGKTMKSQLSIKDTTFVFTGKFDLDRASLERKVTSLGGRVAKSVTTKIDVLVAGEKAGSKYNKAIQLNIPIIDSEQLNILLSGKPITMGKDPAEEEELKNSLQEIFGDIRSLLQRPPSHTNWQKILSFVQHCKEEDLETMCNYINAYMSHWDALIAQDQFNHELRPTDLRTLYQDPLHLASHHNIEPEFRETPESWIGELSSGTPSPKFQLIRLLDLRDSKLSAKSIDAILQHPNLTDVSTLLLSEKKNLSKTLIKTLCTHDNTAALKEIVIGQLRPQDAESFEKLGEPRQMRTLNICDFRGNYPSIYPLLHSPMFQTITTLKLPAASNYDWLTLCYLDKHPALFPNLDTLVFGSTTYRSVDMFAESFKNDTLTRVNTINTGFLCFQYGKKEDRNQWRVFSNLRLPESIHTLDLSGLRLNVRAYNQYGTLDTDIYNTQLKHMTRDFFGTLTRGRIMQHIKTVKLGVHGMVPEVIEKFLLNAPDVTRV